MNIKKYSLKTMCAALACTTILSSMLTVYATNTTVYETPMDDSAEINLINALSDDSVETGSSDSGWTTEENSFEDIKVTYQQSSSYAVTIPKTIALGTNKQATYAVKVTGDIDTNQRVYVAPVDGIADSENLDFHMKDLSGKKADVVATVAQSKTYWSSEDVANAYEETQNCVSAPDLTAGTWEGTFQVEIRLETEKAHEHNYVDGKCTICGKETGPYETAPTTAYSNWAYTLDDENNIITLNSYIGSETNVIVYANYVINGKTYKTQLASSPNLGNGSLYMFNGQATGAKHRNITKSIKFSHSIDTSNITSMKYMFYDCEVLEEIDISGFDTSNVTNMSDLFGNCFNLTSIDLSNFDTSNVTDMGAMFWNCRKLASLDVSGFDTSNVTNMDSMFGVSSNQTNSFISLDLSSFDTSKVTSMTNMFNSRSALKTIYVTEGKWSTSQANTAAMFYKCGTSSVTYK